MKARTVPGKAGPIVVQHLSDREGRPAGGDSTGVGFRICWQNGPLQQGEKRKPANGAFVEDVILAAKDRLDYYQETQFACEHNRDAIDYLMAALEALRSRTEDREKRGVEGTHQV